jgi:hypothetical protein
VKEIGIYLGLATFILGLIAHAMKLTFQLTRVEKELRDEMDAQVDNLQRDVVSLQTAGLERAETIRHEFGETASAIRQKIHDVETWNRDTFVRKESFEMVVSRIEKSIEKWGDRFDEKLDKLVERIQQR